MKKKKYKKLLYTRSTYAAAVRRGDYFRREMEKLSTECNRLFVQVRMLAKLASKKPDFDNPLHVFEAEKLRDSILKEMGR